MRYRFRTVATALVIGAVAPAIAFGQNQIEGNTDPRWEMPRLANGQPDLQGYWTMQTFTADGAT